MRALPVGGWVAALLFFVLVVANVLRPSVARAQFAPPGLTLPAFIPSSVLAYTAALEQGTSAVMRNPAVAKPVTTDDIDGQRLVPQVYATFPTCGASDGQLFFGTELEVAASATSAQRRCRCVATGGGSSVPRWLNTNTNNYGATQSDCPLSTVPGPPVAPNPGNPPGGPP